MEGEKKLHVAPMLAVTDRHYRQLCRLLSSRAVLWSEMVHADAVLHNGARLLPFDAAAQTPCVLQLGGSAPETLARAAAIGASEYGYSEITLNVRPDARADARGGCVRPRALSARAPSRAQCGCPSGKVCGKRDAALCFGATLMLDPDHTGECLRCVSARAGAASAARAQRSVASRRMAEAVDVPVSVKCRVRLLRSAARRGP